MLTLDAKCLSKGIFKNGLLAIQNESLAAIIDEANKQGIIIHAQLAYILATSWHESRMQPISEWGGDKYLKSKPYYPFFGRGFVQLTWKDNYKKQGDRLGIDLVSHPEGALDIPIAANILVYGMIHGSFTGKKLSDYITTSKVDFIGARRLINGQDKALLISGYAKEFLLCIK